jgi:hypothetical protein
MEGVLARWWREVGIGSLVLWWQDVDELSLAVEYGFGIV